MSGDDAFLAQEVERLAADVVARLHDARLVTDPDSARLLVEEALARGLQDLAEMTTPAFKDQMMQAIWPEMQSFFSSVTSSIGQIERQHLEDKLTPTRLEVLRLLEFEHLSLRGAAERMGMKLDNLNYHLRRAAKAVGIGSVKTLRERYRTAFAESADDETTRM